MVERKLPPGWRWTRLGDVCEFLPARSIASDGDTDVVAVTSACLTEMGFRSEGLKVARMWRNDAQVCALSPGEVLVARSNTPDLVGRVSLYTGKPEGVVASDLTIRLWAGSGILPAYLSAFMSFLYVSGYWKTRAGGASGSMKKITRQLVSEVAIPIPSLPVQEEIVGILGKQIAHVDRAYRAALDQELYLRSLLTAFVRTSLTDGTTTRTHLGSVLEEVTQGVGSDWSKYCLIGATRDGVAAARTAIGKTPGRYKLVDRGMVFYNPMRILIGSIGMIDEDDPPGITSPDYVVFRTKSGALHHRWFYYWLRSSYGEEFIKTVARGAVRERMLFHRLAEREIEIPAWDVQVRAANNLAQAERAKSQLMEQIASISNLPAAVLEHIFKPFTFA